MESHGGWLVLGSVYDSERNCVDTGHAFFWAAGDRFRGTLGTAGMLYATFKVLPGRRG